MKLYIFFVIILILIIAIFNSGCSTSRVLNLNKKNICVDSIYNQIQLREIKYDNFSFKYSARVKTQDDKFNFNGQIKILRDSIIWVSLTPGFGIEMARVYITKDSLKFMNRINSTYFEGDFSYLCKLLGMNIDYNTIQSILTNEFFVYPAKGKRIRNLIRYKGIMDKEAYLLEPIDSIDNDLHDKKDLTKDIIQKLFIHPELYKLFKFSISDSVSKQEFSLEFSDYIDVNNSKFPQNLYLHFNNNSDSIRIDINYQKITVNTDLKFNYKVPDKYKLVSE